VLMPDFLEAIPLEMVRLILDFENHTLLDIARRLKANQNAFTSTAAYQLKRLNELNSFNSNYKRRLQQLLNLSDAEINRIFEQAAIHSYGYDKSLFDAKGIDFIPFAQNEQLKQLAYVMARQTRAEFRNITRTAATKMTNSYGNAVSIPRFFEQTLDNTAMRVATGAQSYDIAIREAIRNMTDSGIVNIAYDKNGRKIRRSIETVVRTTVLTGVGQMADKITVSNFKELGAEHVIVSSHDGARVGEGIADHSAWQGRVYHVSDETKEKMTGILEAV